MKSINKKILALMVSTFVITGTQIKVNSQEIKSGDITYTVQKGDTLYSISQKFDINYKKIMEMNSLEDTTLFIGDKLVIKKSIDVEPENVKFTYTVKQGDNVYKIADRFDISSESIIEENELSSPYLYIGDKLVIDKSKKSLNSQKPLSNTKYTLETGNLENTNYTVKQGDNYYTISKKFGINYKTLMKKNNTNNPYLYIGDKVLIDNKIVPSFDNSYKGLVINLPEKKLYSTITGQTKVYDISIGQPKAKWQTPTGDFVIRRKVEKPTWYVPESIQEEMKQKGQKVVEKIPPGPNNPLGTWWMGFGTGIGLHSTNNPTSVGYSVSHGCIRLKPNAAKEVFNSITENETTVKIVYQPVKLGLYNNSIYLSAFPNIYYKNVNLQSIAEDLIKSSGLENGVNWEKVSSVVNNRSGIPVKIGNRLL